MQNLLETTQNLGCIEILNCQPKDLLMRIYLVFGSQIQEEKKFFNFKQFFLVGIIIENLLYVKNKRGWDIKGRRW